MPKGYIKSPEEFKQNIFDLVGTEYDIIGNYINNQTKIKFIHNKCKREFEMLPYVFLRGSRCSKCNADNNGIKRRKTQKQLVQEIFNLVGKEYDVISEYKNSTTKVKFRHNVCGNEYYALPWSIQQGRYCKKCGTESAKLKRRKPQEQFEKEIRSKYNNEFIVKSLYINNYTKIKLFHKICGSEFYITPHNFLRNKCCPVCMYSNEKKCRKIFEKLTGKKFYSTFSVLKIPEKYNIKRLQLDGYNEKLKLAFEYQGEQHYGKHTHLNKLYNYKTIRKRDNIKKHLCKKQGITLIVIPYWEQNNLENYIKENLKF